MGILLKSTTRSWGGLDEGHYIFSLKTSMPFGRFCGKSIRSIIRRHREYLIGLYYKHLAIDFTDEIIDMLNIKKIDKPSCNDGVLDWISDVSVHTIKENTNIKHARRMIILNHGKEYDKR